MKHGTGGYTTHRCRCHICVTAWRAYQRERTAKVRRGEITVARHGLSGYNQGCRCDVCRAAMSEYQSAYRKARGQLTPFQPHSDTCECSPCRAHRERAKTWSDHLARVGPPGVKTGIRHGLTGYSYHQCRCERCVRAKSAYARKRYKEQGPRY